MNALQESAWGTFTIGASIPLALFMGLYMYRFRKGRIAEATAIGVVGLLLAVDPRQADRGVGRSGRWFQLSREQLIVAMGAYGFVASVLPVWLLLCPRDYLSSFMKIGTIAFLVLAVMVVNPELQMPAISAFAAGGGPIIPGPLFPFAFITIACGAISGFHALIASGTTPKMIDRESDIRPIGYGAMLIEGLVGVMALIAATAMFPGDYFAINTLAGDVRRLSASRSVNLPQLESRGRRDRRRPHRRRGVAGGRHRADLQRPARHARPDGLLVSLRDHVRGAVHPHHDRHRHARRALPRAGVLRPVLRADGASRIGCPARSSSTLLVVCAWGYFIWTGSISTIWPMFGIANQLLASVALAVGTTIIINSGKARYAWVTLLPLAFVAVTTLTAGVLSVRDNFWPMAIGPNRRAPLPGLPQHHADGHDDGVGGRHPHQRRVAMDAGPHRPDSGDRPRRALTPSFLPNPPPRPSSASSPCASTADALLSPVEGLGDRHEPWRSRWATRKWDCRKGRWTC